MRAALASCQRGFALLLVLWCLALLALLGTHVVATGRAELRLATNLRSAAAAEAAADGAVQAAIYHLLEPPPRRWQPDGLWHEMPTADGAVVVIRIENEQGKVNPNLASAGVLRALLVQAGAEPRPAAALAAAILDWRSGGLRPRPGGAKEPQYRAAGRDYAPPGRPFQSLEELGLVLGMPPGILARIRPYLSLYQGGEPDRRFAAPAVLAALREAADTEEEPVDLDAEPGGAPVVAITAQARERGGGRFIRQAHVRLGPGRRARPWQILGWRALASD